MKEKEMSRLTNLHEFLADTEGQTKNEVAEELRQAGVDVEKFNSEVRSIVDAVCRRYAGRTPNSKLGELRNKTREEILQLLAQIQAGVFGSDLAEMLAARQRQEKGLGEQDIQQLLEEARSRVQS
jgi:superfamily I DNA/RNA helicase